MALFMACGMIGTRQSLRCPPLLNLRILLLHIADDGLPPIVHMNMLDADNLLPASTQPSKNLDLDRISPHQTSRPAKAV
jgi:hypothetical protein